MSMTDPIADLLTRIRNALIAKHDRLDVPASKLKLGICKLFQDEGFVERVQLVEATEEERARIRIFLRYTPEGDPVIRHVARVSRPGRRVYQGSGDLKPVLRGLGVQVVSTSHGLLSDSEARRQNVGGEVLCEIW